MARVAACCRPFPRALTGCLWLAGPSSRSSDVQGSPTETDGGNRSQTHSVCTCPRLIIIPPSCLAPSGIWGLFGRLSLSLLDFQDFTLFFYFNMLL